MKAVYWLMSLCLICIDSFAQDVAKKLLESTKRFELDSQMRHAIYSLYVIDAKTGKVVFDKNSQIGLAPASCQKLFTSGVAFELLGQDYRFRTTLGYRGKIENGSITGDLLFMGTGDPTLGSWRFEDTKQEVILRKLVEKIKELKVSKINSGVYVSADDWSTQTTPDGWVWQDIGNYYGAGSDMINWRENQYDVELSSGRILGDKVKIVGINPALTNVELQSEVTGAPKETGDNAYIYLAPGSHDGIIRGTIPVEEEKFQISGSNPNPAFQFLSDFKKELEKNNIDVSKTIDTSNFLLLFDKPTILATIYSPSLDSINYWFLRRSINLYGEALVKVIAYEKKGFGATDSGVAMVRDFWSQQGIDKAAINIIDGSGLSPQNRVTTNALVTVLKYAKTRPWYNSFYLSLPTYNGMKMKSGSIGGARSFAGYHVSKGGHEYIFAIIVNNYDGSSAAIVNKMYKVLDNLK